MFEELLGQIANSNSKNVRQQLMDSVKTEFADCKEPLDVWAKLSRLGYSVDFTICQSIYTYVNYGKINELMKVYNLPLIMNRKDYEVKLVSALSELASRKSPRYA